MPTFNLISNITNGAGLQKDTTLLARMLESYGHEVSCTMFNSPNPTLRQHDVNIFIEVVAPVHMAYARQNWIVPNPEWWYPCWDPILPRVQKVLCKTRDCFDIWRAKVGPEKPVLVGFEANDIYRPEIPRKATFLHLAGKSETKNTAAVMAAWRDFNLPYPLIVSAFKPEIVKLTKGVPNVTQVDRFSDEDAIRTINECRFHIMPSKYEGYGHAIHEALGCKGVVITTNAAPMNSFGGVEPRMLITSHAKQTRLLTFFHEVHSAAVAQSVHRAAQLYPDDLAAIGDAARAGFLADREAFRKSFAEVISNARV